MSEAWRIGRRGVSDEGETSKKQYGTWHRVHCAIGETPVLTVSRMREALFQRLRDGVGGDLVHAAEVERAIAQEARAAFDLVPDDVASRSARAGERGLGRAEDRDERDAEEIREVHCAGVIGE